MKTKHGLLFGFAVIAIAAIVTFTGCKTDAEEGGGGGPSPTEITYSSSGGSYYLDIAFTGLYSFNGGSPALTDFVVTVDGGSPITPSGKSASNKIVRLTLASALPAGSYTIKVVYTYKSETEKFTWLDDAYSPHDLGSFEIEQSVTVN